jgi:hypothetical protein
MFFGNILSLVSQVICVIVRQCLGVAPEIAQFRQYLLAAEQGQIVLRFPVNFWTDFRGVINICKP